MRIGDRPIITVCAAILRVQHWKAAANMFRVYDDVVDAYARYIFARGGYPASICVRTPLGRIHPTIYSHHDMLTINEIFCRQDYRASASDRIVVDFGSNIGISALYFLTRNHKSFVYCYEPLPMNCARFKKNLEGFEGRYQLAECAVALEDGTAQFGFEETGRYGGIGKNTGSTMTVECRNAINILSRILDQHGEIDVLKIDIETLETEILLAIPGSFLPKIRKIYIEQQIEENPLRETHSFRQYGSVAQFFRNTISKVK